MINWGTVPLNSVIPFVFDTFAGSTGAPITLTGLATTDIEVYKGTSMTQRASDNGFALMDTDGIDIDTRTGIHGFSIDTSDNSDAGFYAAGSFYWVVVDAVTIDSQTVRFVAGTFRLSVADTSAGRPDVNVTHAAGTAWGSGAITSGVFATGAITAGAIAADAIGASELAADAVAEIADAVWDEDATGHQTQGTFGQAIGDPVADTNTIYKAVVTDATGATVGVDVAAVLDDTGTSGVALANDSITAAKIANGAIDAATFAADVDAEILSYLVDDATRIDASSLNTATVTTIPAILVDTAEIGAAGAGLTAINLPDQTMNITGDITGNLSGSVGSVTGAVGSVTGNVGGNVVGSVASVTAPVTVGTNNDKTGYRLSSTGVDDVLRTALTEGYAADGAAPTLEQFLYMVWTALSEFAISGTTITCKKLDGTTTSMTFTLDDATNPTSRTRAT